MEEDQRARMASAIAKACDGIGYRPTRHAVEVLNAALGGEEIDLVLADVRNGERRFTVDGALLLVGKSRVVHAVLDRAPDINAGPTAIQGAIRTTTVPRLALESVVVQTPEYSAPSPAYGMVDEGLPLGTEVELTYRGIDRGLTFRLAAREGEQRAEVVATLVADLRA